MKFSEAKNLRQDEKVLVIKKSGNNPVYKPERVVEVTIEDKDAFIRCTDGSLYHHTALKPNKV